MQIVCTKTYRFPLSAGGSIVVSPSPLPQDVPDELKSQLLFQWAVKDRSIREISFANADAPKAEAEAAEAAKPAKSSKAAK